jgi:hypothetical protein
MTNEEAFKLDAELAEAFGLDFKIGTGRPYDKSAVYARSVVEGVDLGHHKWSPSTDTAQALRLIQGQDPDYGFEIKGGSISGGGEA